MYATTGSKKTKYLWGLTCPSWGIHFVGQNKKEMLRQDRKWGRSLQERMLYCGPHGVVKLVPQYTKKARPI